MKSRVSGLVKRQRMGDWGKERKGGRERDRERERERQKLELKEGE